MSTSHLQSLAEALVSRGLLSREQADDAVQKAHATQIPFAHYIVDHNLIDAKTLAYVVAKTFDASLLDLTQYNTSHLPIHLMGETLIRQHYILPLFKRDNRLFIATADPSQHAILGDIKRHTGSKLTTLIVEADMLGHLIKTIAHKKEQTNTSSFFEEDHLDDLIIESSEETIENEEAPTDDAPMVRFVNKMLLDAIEHGASDIHFEPYEDSYRIRFRTDGILKEMTTPPVHLGKRIASRLKIMSQLDISERRLPQDGRFKLHLSEKQAIDFRVSTCPTVNGEKIVLRLLDPAASRIDIVNLGLSPTQKKVFIHAIEQPQGMVLVTGPTGSGKTVTLYTALNRLNTLEKNISTVEDPVELKIMGINQVNINTKAGLHFSSVLRAFLRQDPDIIMIGEMRDLETADTAIKAAQTGHLVLSSLHTNSAADTLTRLSHMGIAPYNIAGTVSLIIAQRLARRLCEDCKKPLDIKKAVQLECGIPENKIGYNTFYGPVGCDHCITGYKGRIGLFEVLPINSAISHIIMQGGTVREIEQKAREENMCTLRQSGIEKVLAGITSLEEINRVTEDTACHQTP